LRNGEIVQGEHPSYFILLFDLFYWKYK
jgi:hypothetical protein